MANNHVLICVTRQKTCEKLIVEGAHLAAELQAELSVLHVAKPGINFLGNPIEGDALEYLYKISSEHGADMTVIRSDDIVHSISGHIGKVAANHIIMGRSKEQTEWDMTYELKLLRPDIDMHIVMT